MSSKWWNMCEWQLDRYSQKSTLVTSIASFSPLRVFFCTWHIFSHVYSVVKEGKRWYMTGHVNHKNKTKKKRLRRDIVNVCWFCWNVFEKELFRRVLIIFVVAYGVVWCGRQCFSGKQNKINKLKITRQISFFTFWHNTPVGDTKSICCMKFFDDMTYNVELGLVTKGNK